MWRKAEEKFDLTKQHPRTLYVLYCCAYLRVAQGRKFSISDGSDARSNRDATRRKNGRRKASEFFFVASHGHKTFCTTPTALFSLLRLTEKKFIAGKKRHQKVHKSEIRSMIYDAKHRKLSSFVVGPPRRLLLLLRRRRGLQARTERRKKIRERTRGKIEKEKPSKMRCTKSESLGLGLKLTTLMGPEEVRNGRNIAHKRTNVKPVSAEWFFWELLSFPLQKIVGAVGRKEYFSHVLKERMSSYVSGQKIKGFFSAR